MAPIRVVVVDDEAAIARALAEALAMEPDMVVVGIGHNGVEAVDLACRYLPEVVVLDLTMPVLGGLEALRKIKAQTPSTEIVILTGHDDDAHLFTALQAGAKGYLLKVSSLDAIVAGVREVAQGVAAIPPALATRVLEEFQRVTNQPPALGHLFSLLTRQEAEVLKLIGLERTNKQIAEELSVELTTIKKHITNIRQKLEINSRTEAALIARSSGLVDI